MGHITCTTTDAPPAGGPLHVKGQGRVDFDCLAHTKHDVGQGVVVYCARGCEWLYDGAPASRQGAIMG